MRGWKPCSAGHVWCTHMVHGGWSPIVCMCGYSRGDTTATVGGAKASTCCFQSTAMLLFNDPKYDSGLFKFRVCLFSLLRSSEAPVRTTQGEMSPSFDPRRERHPLRANQTRRGSWRMGICCSNTSASAAEPKWREVN